MRVSVVKGGQFAIVVAGLLLFYKIRPYFFWFGIFESNYVNAFVTIILGTIFFLNLRKMDKSNKVLMALFGIILLAYPFVGAQNLNVFVSIAPLVFLPFASDVFCRKLLTSFTGIYCLVIAVSLVVWALSLFGGIHPYKVIPPLNELKDIYYNVYPLLVRPSDGGFRFSGPFDEPGVVGTMSGLLFCCQKDLYSRNSLILLLSGICSLSLFFFVIAALYFSYSLLFSQKGIKGVIIFLISVVIGILALRSSPILSEKILSRLQFDSSSGMIAGDNRNASFALDIVSNMSGTKEFWLGIEDKWEFRKKVAYSSSFLNVIIMYGFLFAMLIIIFYISYGWVNRKNKMSFLVYVFIVAGTLYQRPEIFDPSYIFLFTFLAKKEVIFQVERHEV